MSNDQPLDADGDGSNGNGRGPGGRFGPGNKFSRGNPHAQKIAAIRSALMEAADPERIKAAVTKLLELAEAGDRFALSEILDRTIGKPTPGDLAERIERLERLLLERNENGNGTPESEQN